MRRCSDLINQVTHSFQQHSRGTEVGGVGKVFPSRRSGILLDSTQGVSSGSAVFLRAHHHLEAMQTILEFPFVPLPSWTHGLAGAPGNSIVSTMRSFDIFFHLGLTAALPASRVLPFSASLVVVHHSAGRWSCLGEAQ